MNASNRLWFLGDSEGYQVAVIDEPNRENASDRLLFLGDSDGYQVAV